MPVLSIIDLSWNPNWIVDEIQKLGVVNHFGYDTKEDGHHFSYLVDDTEVVQSVLNEYPTRYANEMRKPALLRLVTDIRWRKQLTTTFMGKTVPADDQTIARITAAVVLMDADPTSPQTRRWKTGPNADDWVTLDRNALVAMGAKIAAHMQACFDREEELHGLIRAAEDIHDLDGIDIESGWPE